MATILSLSPVNKIYQGASSTASGSGGMAPAPSSGQQSDFLKGDGTWATGSYSMGSIMVFSNSSTYTPSADTVYIQVECVGAGGAGGAGLWNPSTTDPTAAVGGGGGAGQYSKSVIQNPSGTYTITIGVGASSEETCGGDTIFGNNTVVAKGGYSGTEMMGVAAASLLINPGGAGGGSEGGGVGDVVINGQPGSAGILLSITEFLGGEGGDSALAFGGQDNPFAESGYEAQGYGAGGGGACYKNTSVNDQSPQLGGDGGDGVCIITEYTRKS